MQTADSVHHRTRMVVLDEVRGKAQLFELILSKSLHEEAPAVLEHFGHEHNHIAQMLGFDLDLHVSLEQESRGRLQSENRMELSSAFGDAARGSFAEASIHLAFRRKNVGEPRCRVAPRSSCTTGAASRGPTNGDRKSTRLNSSHANISYAVFC